MADDLTGAFGKPFAAQVAAFRIRLGNLVPTATWTDLIHAQHDRAFVVAGAMKADLLADLGAAVQKSIENGTSLQEFRRDFRRIVEKHGWHGWTGEGTKAGEAWRTRVIYKTNMATAYAAGRMAQLVAANYPLWVYRHGGSLEPRIQHLGWDGLILPPDHPFWITHAPPNGWGCSCYVLGARSERGAVRLGGKPGLKLPANWAAPDPRTGVPSGIDKGWAYAPGRSVAEDIIRAIGPKSATLPQPLGADLAATAEAVVRAPTEAEMAKALKSGLKWDDGMTSDVRALYAKAGLTEISLAEAMVVNAYTGPGAFILNQVARMMAAGEDVPPPRARLVEVLRATLAKLKPVEAVTARGIALPGDRLMSFFREAKPGARFEFTAFTSTSRDQESAFAGPLQFIIKARSGRDVQIVSQHPSESEILLPPGLQFTILQKTERDGVLTVWIEEVRQHSRTVLPKEARHAEDLEPDCPCRHP